MAEWGIHTRAVHGVPIGRPVHRTAVFPFETAEEYADVLGDRRPGYVYTRIDNPTADAFAAAVTALESPGLDGDYAGQPFASGMAAISTTLLTLCSTGTRVIAQRQLYGGTYGVLTHVLDRFGVEVDWVSSAAEAATAVRPETALLWVETIANPTLNVADLPAFAAVARDAGLTLVVDSTFATPVICRPLAHGADLVVHSATKYIGGHSDVTGGVVVGSPELIRRVRATRIDLGGSLAPDEAFLLHRGLATLPLRVERHCASAQSVARSLVGHPGLVDVLYPGLPSHPDHAVAEAQFTKGLFGGCVSLAVAGGRAEAQAFCNRLRLATNATSLGGTHTVVSHVASTTHRQFTDEALRTAGIHPATVRIAVGLEDPDDILADIVTALG